MNKFKYPYKSRYPYKKFYLDVDDISKIHIKLYGNPKGIPVLYSFGGPGGFSINNKLSKLFNLKYYHLIVYDPRGIGLSKPNFSIKNNNTKNLIKDIEMIRDYLKIKKLIVTGGSWGAMLSIIYAMEHPENIITYVASAGFYNFSKNIWPISVKNMFPLKWYNFCNLVNISDKDIKNPSFKIEKEICKRYFNKIKKKEKIYIDSWYEFENNLVYVNNKKEKKMDKKDIEEKYFISFYESLYYYKNFFVSSNYFINNVDKIKNIKGYLLHGNLDVICDYKESYLLHKNLPKSKLISIHNEGHGGKKLRTEYINIFKYLYKKLYKKTNDFYYK